MQIALDTPLERGENGCNGHGAGRVTIEHMMQAGLEGVVSALHYVPAGEEWSPAEITRRQQRIATTGWGEPSELRRSIVGSLPDDGALPLGVHIRSRRVSAWSDGVPACSEPDFSITKKMH